jgi:outer membrane protein insertion porin family
MWGCLRAIFFLSGGLLLLLFIVIGGGWYYLGSASFADLVKLRIQKTLEARLGRTVTIRSVTIAPSRPQRIILNDLRIFNTPGAASPYFATVRQIEVTGGIESLWGRQVKVDRVDIRDPRLFMEIYPAGSKLVHNFPQWASGPKSRYEIVQIDIGTLYVTGGAFDFLDLRHKLRMTSHDLASTIKVTSARGIYDGVVSSPQMRVAIQDYMPFDVTLRGGFRYTPGVLALQSIALQGDGIRAFVSGKLDPLSDGVYNLHVTSLAALARVRQIFQIQKTLDGTFSLDGNLAGRQGDFTLSGAFSAPRIRADVYELTSARGRLKVNGNQTTVDITSAAYGGGTISAHYVLANYSEPYPMNVDLRYDGVSVEKLFADWGEKDTGLRGGATGKLAYHWEKDRVLAGAGEGTARLTKNAVAFSNARYPIAVGGSTDFALDRGIVTFRQGALETDASRIEFKGTLAIADLAAKLSLSINSTDFSELDRAAYNFAHSAGKTTYTLLGLGGSGSIVGTVSGKLKTSDVVAHIAASGTKYNNVILGDSDIDLSYAGATSLLTFGHASFRDSGGTLALTGTVGFPDSGPSPQFDLAVDASAFPIARTLQVVNLKLAVDGLGTGKMTVTGTPDAGRVRFDGMTVRQGSSDMRLNGTLAWLPGKGKLDLDLDIAARDFPVTTIAKFFELGTLPLTGNLTGTLHLKGPKDRLEGSGKVTIAKGSIYGEPIDSASADVLFTSGKLKATNVTLAAPAGTITGEAELDLGTNQFSYTIKSTQLDLSKVKLLGQLSQLFGGKLTITSTGAGTVDQPELVLQATLAEGVIKGIALPVDAPPPTIYVAIRNGRLTVKGSAFDAVTIDGDGSVSPAGDLDGTVHVQISDITKLVNIVSAGSALPASGHARIDLQLGGRISSLESLHIEATVPDLSLRISEHEFVPNQPIRLGLRNGRVVFDSFELGRNGSVFSVVGFIDLTRDKAIQLDVKGEVEAALAQLFVPDVRADGHINIALGIRGSLSTPRVTGSAELQDAQVKFTGFPQLIDQINGTILFREDRIEINALQARIGGGTVVAGGYVTTDGLSAKRARLTLTGRDVALRYFQGLSVEGNFNLVLSGDAERIVLQGDVNVAHALYFRDFDLGTSVVNLLLARRGITPVVTASWQDRVSLRIHMTAPDTLAVKDNIADVTATADLDVTGTLANPVVLGLVSFDEGGKIRFQNIDYRVTRGSINFQNPFRIDPFFDVTIEGRVSSSLGDPENAGQYDVTVNINGTLDRITPTITSDPPASDVTLFSILGLGALGSPPRTGAATSPLFDNFGKTGSSLLYQSVINLVGSKILPFADSFTYDQGLLSGTAGSDAKATLEKRLSSSTRAIVIYYTRVARNIEVIEWQVTPDWVLQFTRDSQTRVFFINAIDARFRRQYPGHWTLGRPRNPLAAFAPDHAVSSAIQPLALQPAPPETSSATLHLPAGTTAREHFAGAIVESITTHTDAAYDARHVPDLIAVKTGQPFSSRALQASIKSLYATGDFRDIRVDAEPAPSGVALIFDLTLNYRLGSISFEGIGTRERQRAQRELVTHVGDVASLSAVDRSAVRVQAELAREGFLESTVDPETNFVRERGRADVIFHVAPGPQAKIGAITIGGTLAPFTEAELRGQLREKQGKTFRLEDARADVTRVQRYLVRKDYRKADVRFVGHTYDDATDTANLQYTVDVGPLVKVEVAGVPRSDVRRLIPFSKNQAYSADIIDRAANDIVVAYQKRGYFNAAADPEEAAVAGTWLITFHVVPGQKLDLSKVDFTGNVQITDKKLRGVVATAPSGGIHSLLATLLRRPGGVTKEQLSDDRSALEGYYRLNGFAQATVAPAVARALPGSKLEIIFPITEGPQTILSSVTVEGNDKFKAGLPALKLRAGAPLNPQLLRDDLIALQTFYGDRGFSEVQVSQRIDPSADNTAARLTYVVSEGPKVLIDDVVVRGNTYTHTSVIDRKAELSKGEPFSYTKILEAQRNLYSLGIFQRVEVQPQQAGTDVGTRDVVIQVDEGKDLTVSGSVGVSSGTDSEDRKFRLRGSVSLAHRNLFGTGRYLGLEMVGGTLDQQAFITYREPFIFDYDIPVQLSIFRTDDKTRSDARILQQGTSIEASRIARFQTRWSLRYEYKTSECRVVTPLDLCSLASAVTPIPGIPREQQNVQISSLTPTFFWDKRDDPLNPRRGFFTTASAEYAFPLFSAKTSFFKEFVQASWYRPVSSRSTFAASARLGLIQPIGKPDISGLGPSDDPQNADFASVPFSERFTAGGESSNRAFSLDNLGILASECSAGVHCETLVPDPRAGHEGKVLAIGGNALALLNLEYRFPIVGAFGGALFADGGNVWRSGTDIALRQFRWGLGTGFRYITPVGPARFDIGYKLRAVPYEGRFGFNFSLGYAF